MHSSEKYEKMLKMQISPCDVENGIGSMVFCGFEGYFSPLIIVFWILEKLFT